MSDVKVLLFDVGGVLLTNALHLENAEQLRGSLGELGVTV